MLTHSCSLIPLLRFRRNRNVSRNGGMRAEAKRRRDGATLRLLRKMLCFFLPFLLHTRADPFPKPLAEERRGGLLFIPMPGPVDSYDYTFNKSHRHRHHHHRLTFESVGVDSDILAAAFKRYETILTTPCLHMAYEFDVVAPEALLDPSNRVDRVLVYVQSADLTLVRRGWVGWGEQRGAGGMFTPLQEYFWRGALAHLLAHLLAPLLAPFLLAHALAHPPARICIPTRRIPSVSRARTSRSKRRACTGRCVRSRRWRRACTWCRWSGCSREIHCRRARR